MAVTATGTTAQLTVDPPLPAARSHPGQQEEELVAVVGHEVAPQQVARAAAQVRVGQAAVDVDGHG